VLLAVDVGNTQTVIGLFDGEELVDHWRIATVPERTHDELALMIQQFLAYQGYSFHEGIDGVAITSGVARATSALRHMTERYFGFSALVVEPGVKTGMPILYDNPREVGPDRIVDAVAAFEMYGGPMIVVDFGTATVFDAISAKGEYLGGALVPGIEISMSALYTAAPALRAVEIVPPRNVIGRSTAESIQSGVLYGYAGLTDRMVELFQEQLGGPAAVISTGGLAWLMTPSCRLVQHHEPWLTLQGLRIVFDRNR
jgi:type III pantothenate kinase